MYRNEKKLKVVVNDFERFVYRIRFAIIALTAFVFIIHFRMRTVPVPGIDTEHAIFFPDAMYYSWMEIGRQGLVFIKLIFGNSILNPDFAVLLTMLSLIVACVMASFLFNLAANEEEGYKGEGLLVFLFGAIIVSHPIMTEQFYFTLQAAEVSFSLVLMVLSLLGTYLWDLNGKILWMIPSVFLLVICFSCYQTFVPFFVAGAVAVIFVRDLFSESSTHKLPVTIGRFICVFLAAFILNQLITMIFFGQSSYLSEQIYWLKYGFAGSCLEVLSHIRDVCVGFGTFYFTEFGILCLVLLVLMVQHWISIKVKSIILKQAFLLIAWYASPFYLTVLLGMRPVVRAQFILPFTTAATAVFCVILFAKHYPKEKRSRFAKIAFALMIVLSIETVYHEAKVTSALYYTDAVRAAGDYELAVNLQKDIAIYTGETDYTGAILFWGKRDAAKNASCIEGDVMGHSFFEWDTEQEPAYYYSTARIIHFMNVIGLTASYTSPWNTMINVTKEDVKDAPCYPLEGSIFRVGDTLVVKLSEY